MLTWNFAVLINFSSERFIITKSSILNSPHFSDIVVTFMIEFSQRTFYFHSWKKIFGQKCYKLHGGKAEKNRIEDFRG